VKLSVLIAVIIANLVVALIACTQWFGAIIGLLVGVGFSIPLQHAIKTGTVHTMQDGQLTFSDNPMRYIGVFFILVAGYVFGLLAPWIIK
jgi:hypothetical protein